MPEITVVIPLYNKGSHIARTINTILSQTFQDFEVIVQDDGSTDNGAEIVKGFKDPRIRLIQQDNHGVSIARNRAADNATSDLIAFLDADDEWEPSHLETLIRLRKKYPGAGIYATSYKFCQPDGTVRKADFKYIPDPPWEGIISNYFKSSIFGDPPVWTSATAIPKNIFFEMGGFKKYCGFMEDSDLWGRIALKYPVAFSWDGNGIYHLDATNRICNQKEPVEDDIFNIFARNALKKGDINADLVDDIEEYIALKQIVLAWRNIEAGRRDLAKYNLDDCNTQYHKQLKIWTLLWSNVPTTVYRTIQSVKKAVGS